MTDHDDWSKGNCTEAAIAPTDTLYGERSFHPVKKATLIRLLTTG